MDIAMIVILVFDVESATKITRKMAKTIFTHAKVNHELSRKVMTFFHQSETFV